MDKLANCKKMSDFMQRPENRKIYQERTYKVKPMQDLVKDLFDLDHCRMRGDVNNRWFFTAMGLTIRMHQLQAYKEGKSTWNIKAPVLG
jgi:hypothetical protein